MFVRIIAFLKQGLETVIFSYRVIRGVRETAATPALHLSHLGSGSLKGSRSSTESQPLPDLRSQGQHPVFLPALPPLLTDFPSVAFSAHGSWVNSHLPSTCYAPGTGPEGPNSTNSVIPTPHTAVVSWCRPCHLTRCGYTCISQRPASAQQAEI